MGNEPSYSLGGRSLYELLAEPAPASRPRGETSSTRAKETVDNDRERVDAVILLEIR